MVAPVGDYRRPRSIIVRGRTGAVRVDRRDPLTVLFESVREEPHGPIPVACLHGARNVRVFGSVARGDATEASDVDFLVEMEEGKSLLDLVGLWQDLQDLLGLKVDVISDGGISPHLRAKILAEAVPL